MQYLPRRRQKTYAQPSLLRMPKFPPYALFGAGCIPRGGYHGEVLVPRCLMQVSDLVQSPVFLQPAAQSVLSRAYSKA
jgi:hypothetical protein